MTEMQGQKHSQNSLCVFFCFPKDAPLHCIASSLENPLGWTSRRSEKSGFFIIINHDRHHVPKTGGILSLSSQPAMHEWIVSTGTTNTDMWWLLVFERLLSSRGESL
jgi:hypothetical protein